MVYDLVKIVRQYPEVTVVIAGAMKYVPLFSEVPARQLRLIEWVEYNHYPELLSSFDLALVPVCRIMLTIAARALSRLSTMPRSAFLPFAVVLLRSTIFQES